MKLKYKYYIVGQNLWIESSIELEADSDKSPLYWKGRVVISGEDEYLKIAVICQGNSFKHDSILLEKKKDNSLIQWPFGSVYEQLDSWIDSACR